jgi:hypothetical protein
MSMAITAVAASKVDFSEQDHEASASPGALADAIPSSAATATTVAARP